VLHRRRAARPRHVPLLPLLWREPQAEQIYGATEASALVAFQRDDQADPNTVGRPVPGVELRIADDGELLIKAPGVFVGYYKQEEATREALSADGWLKTGDAGIIDPQGQLAIIDRAKDVGKLNCGTPFAPQFIENKRRRSPRSMRRCRPPCA
jgi:long-chain acyl-CoA synthetase